MITSSTSPLPFRCQELSLSARRCDGGINNASGNPTCGLTIETDVGTTDSQVLAGPIDAGLLLGVRYRLVATADTSGALTVEIFQGSTLVARRGAHASGPISVSNVGFVAGRAMDGFPTYVDNFSFTSTP